MSSFVAISIAVLKATVVVTTRSVSSLPSDLTDVVIARLTVSSQRVIASRTVVEPAGVIAS